MKTTKQLSEEIELKDETILILIFMLFIITGAFIIAVVGSFNIQKNAQNNITLEKSYAILDGMKLWNLQVIASIQNKGSIPIIINETTIQIPLSDICKEIERGKV